MPGRFYFHLVGENDAQEDREGTVLTGRAAAMTHAAIVAGKLAQEPHYLGYHVHMVDDHGNHVVSILVTDRTRDRAH